MKKKINVLLMASSFGLLFFLGNFPKGQADVLEKDKVVMGDCGCNPNSYYFCSCSGFSSFHYQFVSGGSSDQ